MNRVCYWLAVVLEMAVQVQTGAEGGYAQRLSRIITQGTALVEAAAQEPTSTQTIGLGVKSIELNRLALNLRGELLQAGKRRLASAVQCGEPLAPNKTALLVTLGCDAVAVATTAVNGFLETRDRVFLVVARDAAGMLSVIRKGL